MNYGFQKFDEILPFFWKFPVFLEEKLQEKNYVLEKIYCNYE